jgi:hypothetical protein
MRLWLSVGLMLWRVPTVAAQFSSSPDSIYYCHTAPYQDLMLCAEHRARAAEATLRKEYEVFLSQVDGLQIHSTRKSTILSIIRTLQNAAESETTCTGLASDTVVTSRKGYYDCRLWLAQAQLTELLDIRRHLGQ